MDTADYHMLTRELKQMTERIDKLESLLLKHLKLNPWDPELTN